MRFVELFAGGGGMSLGLEGAGHLCVGHAEIEPNARAVLAARWPGVPLYGDVSELSGEQFLGVDLISGGSPCQDLSTAGKRGGLAGARSGLFHQQIRIWRESLALLCLWENVPGALSSNKGEDFATVLSSFVGVGSIAVPRGGWGSAGYVTGPSGVAAWRILDAQFFGVPQRRRRVFVLCSRDPGINPAEVLLESEGLRWDSAPSGKTGQKAPVDAGKGAPVPVGFDERNVTSPDNRSNPQPGAPLHTLHAPQTTILAFQNKGTGTTLPVASAVSGSNGNAGMVFNETGHERWTEEEVAGSLNAHEAKEFHTVVFKPSHFTRGKDGAPSEIMPPLSADADKGDQDPVILSPLTQRPYADRGDGLDNIAGTLDARHAGGFQSAQSAAAGHLQSSGGIPRRLTPRECERLMGWPDDHTLVEKDGKLLSESARYRLCGNGIVRNVAWWIGERLNLVLDAGRV